MDLRDTLRAELATRRARNPRYSLRAFARALGTDHSSLSRVLAGTRRLTPRAIRRLGARAGLPPTVVDAACLHENARRIVGLLGDDRFRPNSRWLAVTAGIPVDDVNRALQDLLRRRQLTMRSAHLWVVEAR